MKKHICSCSITASVTFLKLLLFLDMLCYINTAQTQPQLTFTPYIQNLNKPIDIKNAGDGSGRLFIVEQRGLVRIFKNGSLLSKPFLDLRNKVSKGEYMGVYNIAFHPDHARTGIFFMYYADKDGNTIISRYRASKTNPDSALPDSEVVLFTFPRTETTGPYLGDMHFGNDGYLYISISDGSFYTRVTNFAQNGQLLFGKILRLNVNVKAPPYYSIPSDNPFVNDPDVRDEIWVMGLHNAWRWSFDKPNGNLWIGDTGGERWDEVDFRTSNQAPATNFGWPCFEANSPYKLNGCSNRSDYTFPIFSYGGDSITDGSAIIGGYVYRGNAYPQLKGYYICADYIIGYAWKIRPAGS